MTAKGNAVLIEALGSSLRYGGSALEDVPALLKRVLTEEAWREFVTQRGEHVEHGRFAEFVTTPPLRGIGATVDLVRRIVADDEEALDLLDQALEDGEKQGERTDLVNNVNEVKRPQGNSGARALRKLRRDAPELHAEVLAGNLSRHAAMVRAGFRPKTFTVRADDAESTVRSLRKHMSADALARLARLLTEED